MNCADISILSSSCIFYGKAQIQQNYQTAANIAGTTPGEEFCLIKKFIILTTLEQQRIRRKEREREERIDGEPYRGMVNIYQPISGLTAGREGEEKGGGAEQRVDAPLIDLHKIAVSWLRLLALRADKKEGGWTGGTRRVEARSLPI